MYSQKGEICGDYPHLWNTSHWINSYN